ncbi:MAG TPA: hypothetical protein VLI69_03690 [Gammaproteobacteria bacterium]|nr:hypothetical protein [Gammaproteobacteria bacterium]
MRYRVIFVLIFIVGLIDLTEQIFTLSKSSERVKNLKNSVIKKENIKPVVSSRRIIPGIDKEKIMQVFFKTAENSGLSMDSVSEIKDSESNKIFSINAIFLGNFQQITEFIKRISSLCFPVIVRQAEFLNRHEQLILNLKLDVFNVCINPAINQYSAIFQNKNTIGDPFEKILYN